ncbi:hypothetical protein GF340_02755 [Candidatus Peregrinibacteria bacterium]|nr:hypothetical protein [Candidatus Peregrinibacteria bacterium]
MNKFWSYILADGLVVVLGVVFAILIFYTIQFGFMASGIKSSNNRLDGPLSVLSYEDSYYKK